MQTLGVVIVFDVAQIVVQLLTFVFAQLQSEDVVIEVALLSIGRKGVRERQTDKQINRVGRKDRRQKAKRRETKTKERKRERSIT